MKAYRHLFFDLDHTLWDFQANSRVVLNALYTELDLREKGIPSAAEFIATYEEINRGLWERYEEGRMAKEVMRALRFRNTFLQFGVKDDRTAGRLGEAYLERTPRMGRLNDGVRELLDELRPRYALHIITNGYDATQATKLESSGIRAFFDQVITSERAGAPKPDARIFHKALHVARARSPESLMIGDSLRADMQGARGVGMDHVHYAPEGGADPEATYRIAHFAELRAILLR